MKITTRLQIFTTFFAVILLLASCKKESSVLDPDGDFVAKKTSEYDARVAQAYTAQFLKMIKETPGWSPPVAARGLGYVGLALYESTRPGIPGSHSMAGQLNELNALPEIESNEKYHWELCASEAMYHIILDMIPTCTPENLDLLTAIYNDFDAEFSSLPTEVYDRSVAFGQAIADAVFEYSKTDGGHECYATNFPADYVPPVGDGMWVPTPPGYSAALQPYWGSVRPFLAADLTETVAVPPYAYSTSTSSKMYESALEIYNYVKYTTPEQTAIALFWADDGGTVTPPGHAVSILKQVIDKEGSDLALASKAYAQLGLSLNDAFIACWSNKFIYSLVRPVTYIIDHIDPTFTTIVVTPPFPEYTSGHSQNMGAFSYIMESIFGQNYAFTDDTHAGVHPARSFTSFDAAANEAAISRMYGGIHYRQACTQGVRMGHIVGKNIAALQWD